MVVMNVGTATGDVTMIGDGMNTVLVPLYLVIVFVNVVVMNVGVGTMTVVVKLLEVTVRVEL